jgi:protease IV
MHGSRSGGTIGLLACSLLGLVGTLSGCHEIPIHGMLHTDSQVGGSIHAQVDVQMPSAPDPGPMVPVVVRSSAAGPAAPRVTLVDVDGLLLNQNLTGLYSVGENPVAAFREKLQGAACDPRVRAVVLRINSPGGGVTASDILAEELRRFRAESGKPVVACLMDLATGGAYYLAVGCDRIVAHPTTITGGVGAVANFFNLEDAMAQLSIRAEPIKAGELVDMGSCTTRMSDESRKLLQEMADGFRDRFSARVVQHRPGLRAQDRKTISDGRVVAAPRALALHLVDQLGYVDDAIAEAERLARVPGAEVVLFQRSGYPARSIYAITPNVPLQGELVPFSYPGLDRSKLPTFLYLWQPDPTVMKLGGR